MESNFIVIATGNEITAGEVVNTNASYLAQEITALSGEVIEHRSVRDGLDDISECLAEALKKVNHVVVTGGLGPTTDDVTRNAVAKVSDRELILSEEAWADITALFQSMGRSTGGGHKAQCHFPEGAIRFRNKAGTADGFLVTLKNNKHIWVLPGPPRELKSVWQNGMRDKLKSTFPPLTRQLHKWTFLGRGESEIADFAEEAFEGLPVQLGYRAKVPYVILKVWVNDSDLVKIGPAIQKIEDRFLSSLVAKGDFDSVASLSKKIKTAFFYDLTPAGVFARRLLDNKNSQNTEEQWNVSHWPSGELDQILAKYAQQFKTESVVTAEDVSTDLRTKLREMFNDFSHRKLEDAPSIAFSTFGEQHAALVVKVKEEIKIHTLNALWNRKVTDDRLQLYFVEKFLLSLIKH